jgi:CubicO group peptidase (beta-lactamase class C family)
MNAVPHPQSEPHACGRIRGPGGGGIRRGDEFNKAYSAGGYYDIGSATEAFTAWAVYGLVDAGKLGLTTSLAELFPNAPPDKRAITIEQLLGHTSGLGSSFAADGEGDRDVAIDKLLAEPLAQPPAPTFSIPTMGT